MDAHYLSILEYPKITRQLADHTSFSASRERALALRPSAKEAVVRRRLQETTEAKALLSERPEVTIGGARDVRPAVERAALDAVLQPEDLLDIRSTLASGRRLRALLQRLEDDYPLLAGIASRIRPLTHIVEEIERCLDEEGRVLDSASAELARIRHESGVARERLVNRLQEIVNSSRNAAFLQEHIVTERNGRYVIPLKVEHKRRIPGIVHDQSASGATLFIEPLSTVELNNRWHELQLAEKREVERILRALSALVGHEAKAIAENVAALAELDLILAKARYSFALKARPADISSEAWPTADADEERAPGAHPLNLVRARHPLLPEKTVVPIDVYVGGDFTALVITGPNTGGKTVALKTVGLLSAMSQAGMHIPVGDGSRLPVFTGIYADIGDEQSIEQNLSTFSSHMSHIIDILHRADEGSLVLLDELGAGTDPVEGAGLAQALISALLERRCLTLCSSHYSRLKMFASATPRVQNASVEFDAETLSPTYRLTIGLPGRSNAFAIAKQLGLNESIIEKARGYLSPEDLESEALLTRAREANDEAEDLRHEAEERRAHVQTMEEELQERLAHIEEERQQALEEALKEGRERLARLRGEIRRLRSKLAVQGAEAPPVKEAFEEIDRMERELAPAPPTPERTAPREPLHVGDRVYVKSIEQTGEIASIDEEEAEVFVGGLKLRTPLSTLSLRAPALEKAEKTDQRPAIRLPRVESPGMELHLRGRRAEEVGPILDKYLDDASLAGLPWVHIIHGKGEGVLKKVVREQLEGHPLVASYRGGKLSEGGDGMTVVELASLSE
ncbi:MAG: endonuclease MutS2 [Chloroflexota bacterium]|nr:endonuclease MutS2 [Chloroflexota bacterium]